MENNRRLPYDFMGPIKYIAGQPGFHSYFVLAGDWILTNKLQQP